ncbi:MAG TPA: zinc ribbon domain-containing protein [Steroidobacteraceae bacterium]|nr:zinc ribbon domain-containing protein [Steroidobacteraceae bacterium]
MPFYEYQCRACGAEVEVLQKVSDAPLRKCPKCGRNQLTRLVSAPVFRLKGGGWYETDFKSDQDRKRNLVEADKPEAKAEPKADVKPETKSETKSDTKPEAKAEAKPAPAAKKKTPSRARGSARR